MAINFLCAFMILLSAIPAAAQSDTMVSFSEVVMVEGQSKNQLFEKGREWLNSFFRNSRFHLQGDDREVGELSGNCIISSNYDEKFLGQTQVHQLWYRAKVSIWVKDEKYMFEITDFDAAAEINEKSFVFPGPLTSSEAYPRKVFLKKKANVDFSYQSMKKYAHDRFSSFAEELKKAMTVIKKRPDF